MTRVSESIPAERPRGRGGFRYTEIGQLIQSDAERASRRLTSLIAQHGSQVRAGRAVGVPVRTMVRWISRVARLGYPIGERSKKTTCPRCQDVLASPCRTDEPAKRRRR